MASYRMYCLDGAGKIGSGEWFEAAHDEEALAGVRDKRLPVVCEVWEQNRLVGLVRAYVSV